MLLEQMGTDRCCWEILRSENIVGKYRDWKMLLLESIKTERRCQNKLSGNAVVPTTLLFWTHIIGKYCNRRNMFWGEWGQTNIILRPFQAPRNSQNVEILSFWCLVKSNRVKMSQDVYVWSLGSRWNAPKPWKTITKRWNTITSIAMEIIISMEIHGYSWISMDIHGYSCISIDIHDYPWISMDIHGHPWISMDIHGYPWISMDIHGY